MLYVVCLYHCVLTCLHLNNFESGAKTVLGAVATVIYCCLEVEILKGQLYSDFIRKKLKNLRVRISGRACVPSQVSLVVVSHCQVCPCCASNLSCR